VTQRAARARAVVLVDHGSREPAANRQLAAVARALARRLAGRRVVTAHLSSARPSLPEALEACVAGGAREIVVMPYFLAPGRHAVRDVPSLAREAGARHPGVRIRVAAPLGVHAGLLAAVVDRVRAVARARRGRRSAARKRSRGRSRACSRSA
jgi:sirohydrochlorin ferrochelatase